MPTAKNGLPLPPQFLSDDLSQYTNSIPTEKFTTPDDIREFQAKRPRAGTQPISVNHEAKALLRFLKRVKLASRIRDEKKMLRVKKEPRQMLTQVQKQRLFEAAASKPEWMTADCASLLAANTTVRPAVIRRLL